MKTYVMLHEPTGVEARMDDTQRALASSEWITKEVIEGGVDQFYAVEVNTYSCAKGVFTGNGKRYGTLTEASAAARDLFYRWTAVREWRVVDQDGHERASS